MTVRFDLNMIDSDQPPSWLALCATAEPYNQDSGKCRMRGTTDHPVALEHALDADDNVLTFEMDDGDGGDKDATDHDDPAGGDDGYDSDYSDE